jgi:large subunit ribosomal protein L33
MAVSEQRIKIRLVSEEDTGTFYTTTINKNNMQNKLRIKKYDPKLGKHAWFKQEKIK